MAVSFVLRPAMASVRPCGGGCGWIPSGALTCHGDLLGSVLFRQTTRGRRMVVGEGVTPLGGGQERFSCLPWE